MTDITEHNEPLVPPQNRLSVISRNTAYIIAALLIFLFALDLMISSMQQFSTATAEAIVLATSNPFTGLFIGLLVTAIVQSSSAVTSIIVALVASGSITLQGAVPIIMGANIGTTITSTIVSLGFITKKKEFRRAVAAGTYHDFFNILTTVILFPLEYYYGFLSGLAQYIATTFFNQPHGPIKSDFSFLGSGFSPVINFVIHTIDNGIVVAIVSILLLFGSIFFFRKVLTDMLGFESQEKFQRFFFKNHFKSFTWGLLTTAAIRSSTVTTSLVVPLVAKKVVKLKSAAPFILGANIGTTITAFIAATFNSNAAISIAIAHFLFNFIGVLIFMPIPYLKDIPLNLANGLGKLTLKYRMVGFLYLLLTFFFIPFSLIYLSKGSVDIRELTYERTDYSGHAKSTYRTIVQTYKGEQFGSYNSLGETQAENFKVITIYRKGNILLINDELFELNKPGFCRDGEDKNGKYKSCIDSILPSMNISSAVKIESVYVFEKKWYDASKADSISVYSYVSDVENLLVKKIIKNAKGEIISSDELKQVEKK